jgi:hypothetical protein
MLDKRISQQDSSRLIDPDDHFILRSSHGSPQTSKLVRRAPPRLRADINTPSLLFQVCLVEITV